MTNSTASNQPNEDHSIHIAHDIIVTNKRGRSDKSHGSESCQMHISDKLKTAADFDIQINLTFSKQPKCCINGAQHIIVNKEDVLTNLTALSPTKCILWIN